MLREEVSIIKENHGYLATKEGGCRFCGQIATLEVDPEWQQSVIDELATECCDCNDAMDYARKKAQKENARAYIREQFAREIERKEGLEELLYSIADMAVEEKIKSVSIDITGRVKGRVGMTAKGTVKIERTKTDKESGEA